MSYASQAIRLVKADAGEAYRNFVYFYFTGLGGVFTPSLFCVE
jgi:hypothetical protein